MAARPLGVDLTVDLNSEDESGPNPVVAPHKAS
jgi:hypothetical protein